MVNLKERTRIGTDGASLDGKLDNLFDPFYQRNESKENRIDRYYQPRNRTSRYYPSEEGENNVSAANAYQFGNNLGEGTTFGVTSIYGGRIKILDSLRGRDREKVLEHEKHHRNNPSDSELMTRKKTSTEDFYPNLIVSPTGYN